MACTHTIELKVGSVDLEGELDFEIIEDGAPSVLFRLTGTVEETLHQNAIIQQFLCCLNQMHMHIGEIEKIEICQI